MKRVKKTEKSKAKFGRKEKKGGGGSKEYRRIKQNWMDREKQGKRKIKSRKIIF